MSFSNFIKILFVSYLPIIIFIVTGLISVFKSIKESKKKNMDKYWEQDKNLAKNYKKTKIKDAFNKKDVRHSGGFKNFSKSADDIKRNVEIKNKNNKLQDVNDYLTEAEKSEAKKKKIMDELNLNQTPLSEIPFLKEEVSKKDFEDDFYDFDSEKVADIFVYKEIFDKPLSLR